MCGGDLLQLVNTRKGHDLVSNKNFRHFIFITAIFNFSHLFDLFAVAALFLYKEGRSVSCNIAPLVDGLPVLIFSQIPVVVEKYWYSKEGRGWKSRITIIKQGGLHSERMLRFSIALLVDICSPCNFVMTNLCIRTNLHIFTNHSQADVKQFFGNNSNS